MQQFRVYREEIVALAKSNVMDKQELVDVALDAQPYGMLRELIPIKERRDSGAFFTSSSHSMLLADYVKEQLALGSSIADPACGTGQLLLAAAMVLPVQDTLHKTLVYWGRRIFGADIHEEFVETTKARLVLLAKKRVPIGEIKWDTSSYFPNIIVGNFLENTHLVSSANCILANPPYNMMKSPNGCDWGTGNVSSAAVFLDAILKSAKPGAIIASILPEVLRCGTRYKKLRQKLGTLSTELGQVSLGQFDKWTDIDVFASRIQINMTQRVCLFFQYPVTYPPQR